MIKTDRSFVRVKDVIRVSYRRVASHQVDGARSELEFLRARDAVGDIAAGTMRSADEGFVTSHSVIMDAIMRLEQKMDMMIVALEKMRTGDTSSDFQVKPTYCDLSGSGMLFGTSETFENGEWLVMTLYPGRYTVWPVHVLARVHRIEPVRPGWGDASSLVAVSFEDVTAHDRERIIAHVFDIQRALIRSERENERDNDD